MADGCESRGGGLSGSGGDIFSTIGEGGGGGAIGDGEPGDA